MYYRELVECHPRLVVNLRRLVVNQSEVAVYLNGVAVSHNRVRVRHARVVVLHAGVAVTQIQMAVVYNEMEAAQSGLAVSRFEVRESPLMGVATTMRQEYELNRLKVKRRGPLPAFRDAAKRPMKVHITITLDQDLVEQTEAALGEPDVCTW